MEEINEGKIINIEEGGYQEEDNSEKPEKKSGKKTLIGLCIIAAVGGITALVLHKKKNKEYGQVVEWDDSEEPSEEKNPIDQGDSTSE